MAITLTTLNGAVVIDQNTITLTSATGVVARGIITIDQETLQVTAGYPLSGQAVTLVPVQRGQDGTLTQAHPTGAQVRIYSSLATDFTGVAPQEVTGMPIGSPARQRTSISVTGALPLPLPGNDLDVFLNGTTIIAATLANPTTDMDGCRLAVHGNGKAAHTITYTAGFGNVGGTADVLTFSGTQAQSASLVASGGFWNMFGPLATATASVSGPSLA